MENNRRSFFKGLATFASGVAAAKVATYIPKKEVEQTGKKLDDKFASLPSMIDLDMNINEDGDTLIDMIANRDAEAPDAAFNTTMLGCSYG